MGENKKLINRVTIKIRFSELDPMGVVWHGNYLKFFEDGREAFGAEYDLGYYDVFEHGYMTPVVKLAIDYKEMVRYGDEIIVETEYVPILAAKIIFNYTVYKANNGRVVAKGSSAQVFIDKINKLQLTNPEFYEMWKEKHELS